MADPYIIGTSKEWIITEKPAGLLSVPGKGPDKSDCLYSRLKKVHPGVLVVHRLDQPTSGLMVWALTGGCQRSLGRQFEKRLVKKEYEALIAGTPPDEVGTVALKQRLDVENRPLQILDEIQGKRSVTRWKVLERLPGGVCRVRLYPETGRTHQLRLHMASMHAPILGDTLYGGPDAPRLALHACRLEFQDPETGNFISFTSEVPF